MRLRQRLGSLSSIISPHESSYRAPTRLQIVAWCAVLVGSLFLDLRDYDSFQLGTYQDDSGYAVLTQSLAYTDQYALVNSPSEPAASRYPFGYPLLLTPIVRLFPDNLDAMKSLSLVATLANISLLFWGWPWFSRRASYMWGLAVVSLYAFSPLIVGHTRLVMSEPIFTTFCLCALLLTEQRASPDARNRPIYIALMGIALFFAIFIRTIGLALAISIFGYLLAIKGFRIWKELALIVLSMACLTLIIVSVTPIKLTNLFPSEYLNQFSSPSSWGLTNIEGPLVPRFLGSITDYLRVYVPEIVFPLGGGQKEQALAGLVGLPILPLALSLLFSATVLIGLLTWFAMEGISVWLIFCLFYFFSVVLWPWRGPRFLYPIEPQLVFGLLLGVATILGGAGRLLYPSGTRSILLKTSIAACVVALELIFVYKSYTLDNSRTHVGDLQARSSWMRVNVPPSSIVMSELPETDFIYSQRKTVPYKAFSSVADLEDYINRNNVDYVLIAPELRWQSVYSPSYSDATVRLLPMLQNLASDKSELVYTSDRDWVRVFRVTH